MEAVSLWIFLDPVTGRPARLTPAFLDTWGEAAGGRKVQARNLLGPPPDSGAAERPWPFRCTDLDGLGHVNNAATWEPIEDELDRLGIAARRADLEYGEGIDRGDLVTLLSVPPTDDRTVRLWLTVGGTVRASAAIEPV